MTGRPPEKDATGDGGGRPSGVGGEEGGRRVLFARVRNVRRGKEKTVPAFYCVETALLSFVFATVGTGKLVRGEAVTFSLGFWRSLNLLLNGFRKHLIYY